MSKFLKDLNLQVVLIILIIATVTGTVGFTMGRNQNTLKTAPLNSKSIAAPKTNAFFQSQAALVQGDIISRSGLNILIRNKQGIEETFPLASKISIYKSYGNSPVATVYLKPEDVEVKKLALVNFILEDDQYRVSSITYLSPFPQPSTKPIPASNSSDIAVPLSAVKKK